MSNQRPTKNKACSAFTSTEEIVTTDLLVTYEIETLKPIEDLMSAMATSIPDLVHGAAVESVHFTLCQEGLDVIAARRSNTLAQMAECIFSISAAEQEELVYCQNASMPNCVAFAGGIKIFHKQDCPAEFDMAALLALEEGAGTARFISSINKRLQRIDNIVTRVEVVENGTEAQEQLDNADISSSQQQGSKDDRDVVVDVEEEVTVGGFAVVSIAGLLLLILIVLLCVYRRFTRRSSRVDKSVKTQSLGQGDLEAEGKAGSYASVNSAKLAQKSTKMDALMLSLPGKEQGLPVSSREEFEARDDGVEACFLPDEALFRDDDDSKQWRRSISFSPFRKKKMTESADLVRVASAAPSVETADSHDSYEL